MKLALTNRRIKPKPTIVIQNLDDADRVLAEIGDLQRRLEDIETSMNDAIDRHKDEAANLAAPLRDRYKVLSEGLAVFGELQRDNVFAAKRTINLVFGVLGFRKSAEIKAAAGKKLADVLEALKTHKFPEAIKVTEKVNKDAMRDWTDDKLALVHAVREEKDTFWFEVKEEGVSHG
ncbi:MAG: host-nuclease inhibitor Gam family protein [Nitrospirae bacterium]|nr:host-nuclease inhibitor Gam family protein [Magnetococcales bacterium]HAT50770.1 host-nuclease inhibitor protein Gam [Alphaproteobacteria bacterium]